MTAKVNPMQWRLNRLMKIGVLREAGRYAQAAVERGDPGGYTELLAELEGKQDKLQKEYDGFVEAEMEAYAASPYQLWLYVEAQPEPLPKASGFADPAKEPVTVN